MSNNSNQKTKRYVLTGIFLLIALLIGVEKCTDQEEPQQLSQPDGKPDEQAEQTAASRAQEFTRVEAEWHRRNAMERKQYQTTTAITPDTTHDVEVKTEAEEPVQPVQPVAEKKPEPEKKPEKTPEPETKKPLKFISNPYPKKHQFRFGGRIGGGYSYISNLGAIAESYNVRPNFTMSQKGCFVPRLGFFGTWQYRRIGVELGADYTMFSSTLTENKLIDNSCETTKYRINVIEPSLIGRIYLYKNMYMGAGFALAIPFGNNYIDMTTNRNSFYRQVDDLTRDHLRETVRPRVQFLPLMKLGYANPKTGLELGLEYQYGTSDLLKTNLNDYSYFEAPNNTHFVSFTVGYSIGK